MQLLRDTLQLFFDALTYTHVDVFSALLLFYLAVSAALLLIKLIRGIRK